MIPFIFLLAIVCSLLSQMTGALDSGADAYLKIVWVLPLFFLMIKRNTRFFCKENIFPIIFFALFLLYCTIREALSMAYFIGDDVYNISGSLLVFYISFAFWNRYGTEFFIQKICILLLFCSILLSYDVYVNFFISGFDLGEVTYLFGRKNSMGQILLSCVLIPIVNFKKDCLWKVALLGLSISFSIYLILIMKSRATIVTMFFAVVYLILSIRKKWQKTLGLLLLFSFCCYLFIDEALNESFVQNIMFGARGITTDMDTVSSGRVSFVEDAISLIKANFIGGIGNYYVDCFPVNILLQYGIIGFFIIFCFLYKIAYIVFKRLDKTEKIHLTTFLLLSVNLINSLFEAYAPFGPGVKCFLLWMFLGFSVSELSNNIRMRRPQVI